jgi:hypothetical protein
MSRKLQTGSFSVIDIITTFVSISTSQRAVSPAQGGLDTVNSKQNVPFCDGIM